MKEKKNEVIHIFLELRKKGNDINEQFKTVQGTTVITNEHGVKWDKELEKLLSILLVSSYRLFLDEAYVYVWCDEQAYIQVPYLIYGEQQDVYLDFNSMKLLNREVKSISIVALYKEVKEEGISFTNILPNESNERFFVITKEPANYKTPSNQEVHHTLLEALYLLDREVENEQEENPKEDWKLSDYIEEKLIEKGITKSELAEKVEIKYKTLISKFKINSITGEELIRISIVLDLDLNELKTVYIREEEKNQVSPEREVKHIASLVKIGFTSGLLPFWELDLPQKVLYPLNLEERYLISKQIEQGYTTGYLKGAYPRAWKLRIRKVED